MENIELFVAGIVVTLVVAGALALVVVGAILDGRSDQADDTGVPVHPTADGESMTPRAAADEQTRRATTDLGAPVRRAAGEA